MKIKIDGKEVEAKEIDTITISENWNEYRLEDGKVLLLKNVLMSVIRPEGLQNPDGSPYYQIQTHLVVRIKDK